MNGEQKAGGAADPLLTPAQAAEVLGVKPATLEVWRSNKRHVIPYIKVGRLVRYRRSALAAFLASREVSA
jgi:excisionase family DNA binding protein